MKYKVIGIIFVAFILIISLLIYTHYDEGTNRYHQHKEAMKSNEKYDFSNIDKTYLDTEAIDIQTLSTHLPIVSIDTNGARIPGVDNEDNSRAEAEIKIYDNKDEYNNIDNKATLKSKSLIKYRGNSSIVFEKKGFNIKLINDDGSENHEKVLDMDKHNEWILHGPYIDKTMIRNYMWYNISGEIMDYAPNVRFCEVILNGEYHGLYLMLENISTSNNGRVPITKNIDSDTVTSFIVELNNRQNYFSGEFGWLNNFSDYTNYMDNSTVLETVYPAAKNMSASKYYYIRNGISKFEKTLYSYDYDDRKIGYKSYADIDNFINYAVINEFVVNMDAGNRSTFLYKDPKGKYGLIVWDFNNVFDNYFTPTFESLDFVLHNELWFAMLYRDSEFTERVISRYKILRTTYLSDKYLNNYIDEVIDYLGVAIERNYKRWASSFSEENNYMTNPVTHNPDLERNIISFNDAITQYKNAIKTRSLWLDDNIETLKQFSHESKIKRYNP